MVYDHLFFSGRKTVITCNTCHNCPSYVC